MDIAVSGTCFTSTIDRKLIALLITLDKFLNINRSEKKTTRNIESEITAYYKKPTRHSDDRKASPQNYNGINRSCNMG